jgi:hypothetical protein
MREAWTDVVHVVVDSETRRTIPVLTKEAEHGALSLIVEASSLLLRTDVELDVLLVIKRDDDGVVSCLHFLLLLRVQVVPLLLQQAVMTVEAHDRKQHSRGIDVECAHSQTRTRR